MDVLKALTDIVPETPIVMLTGFRDESIGRLSVSEGAEDFISKADMQPSLLMQASLIPWNESADRSNLSAL